MVGIVIVPGEVENEHYERPKLETQSQPLRILILLNIQKMNLFKMNSNFQCLCRWQ